MSEIADHNISAGGCKIQSIVICIVSKHSLREISLKKGLLRLLPFCYLVSNINYKHKFIYDSIIMLNISAKKIVSNVLC